MLIIDHALENRHSDDNPIRVAMVGAGFIGQAVALQITNYVRGMELVAICNRSLSNAEKAYSKTGINNIHTVNSADQLVRAIEKKQPAITNDFSIVCRTTMVDAIIEVTGNIPHGAEVAIEAFKHNKHFISMNAELDGTLGPILKTYADRAGVVYTNIDGDEPGVIMNLYRLVKGMGIRPVLCGNIKGLLDPYRNPTTQESFARKWNQKPHMVTSFADGTKMSFEQAMVANATGMRVAKRGMHGPTVPAGTPIEDAVHWYPEGDLLKGPGIVDYVIGASPSPGVFVLGTHDHPTQIQFLRLNKMGPGPIYCFYRPFHLPHFEAPNSIARAVLYNDATISPKGPPMVEVVATAKTDLKEGQILDGIGFYMTYGVCENSEVVQAQDLLPMGVAEGCQLNKDIQKDQVITYKDVTLPDNRLIDQLIDEQRRYFNND
jgi:predicted homoserine dehydrogenase-like protein